MVALLHRFQANKAGWAKDAGAFALAAFSTLVGVVVAMILTRSLFKPDVLWGIGGCETGSYIGGGVNLTALALLAGQLEWVKRLSGSFFMGLLALNLFLAVLGIGARISEVIKVGPQVFFTFCVVFVHGVLVYSIGKFLRIDVETLSVASQAAVGGPSTAMALATSKGWTELLLLGVLAGQLGDAIGSYLGVLVACVAKSILVG